MKRRKFFQEFGVLGLGLSSMGAVGYSRQIEEIESTKQVHRQHFNMHGFAAPKLNVVRMGIIGIGNRGRGTVSRFASIEGVEIKALCDLRADRVSRSIESIRHLGHKPDAYSGHEEEWKKVCDRKDIDLIAIVTPWDSHTPMCVYAMEHDKHAYVELPAATSIEDCWRLVQTSERTRKHCIQESGNCHEGIRAVILNMVRKGFFGDIIHTEGSYVHYLLESNFFNYDRHMDNMMWRIRENMGVHGNLYPQHGLVPLIQMLDINYGDRMDYMVSMSSDDFTMNAMAEELSLENDYWKPYAGKDYRGNMNVSMIRTVKGRTIVLQHDVTTPRPRGGMLISGTKGIYQSHPNRIASGHDGWFDVEKFNSLVEEYTPEITKRFNQMVRQSKKFDPKTHSYSRVSPSDWRMIDCLRNGLPMEMNVYEAALSSSIIPLSIMSVKNRSNSVEVPDFTAGAWQTNQRGMDIELKQGGTTRLA
jgi:hypothetical protein